MHVNFRLAVLFELIKAYRLLLAAVSQGVKHGNAGLLRVAGHSIARARIADVVDGDVFGKSRYRVDVVLAAEVGEQLLNAFFGHAKTVARDSDAPKMDVMRRTETAGDTLIGAINNVNVIFKTNQPMLLSSAEVFLNGLNKVDFLDDGYVLVDAFTVQFKEAPLQGDTVAVAYTPATGEVLPPGVPMGLSATAINAPTPQAFIPALALKPLGGSFKATQVCPKRGVCDDEDMGIARIPNGAVTLNPGTPVMLDSTGRLLPADASVRADIIGVVALGAQPYTASVPVVTEGSVAVGVLQQAVPNQKYYLAVGGGMSSNPPTAPGAAVWSVGQALNSTDMLVTIKYFTTRS